jgi:EAL domain-containing protein (putative c-di-GMP-specific phosphodiesterase class I)
LCDHPGRGTSSEDAADRAGGRDRVAGNDRTGYSSLSYVSAFPVDVIKIDKSFIDQLALTSGGEAMVRAVVELVHALGLVAVAEGVEERDQAAALEHIGCKLAQGFLFAKPMAASAMTKAFAPLPASTP